MHNYVLSLNAFSVSPTLGQVTNYLTVNRYVSGFYSPFPGTFLFKSTEPLLKLSDSFKGLFEDQLFTLAEFVPSNVNGTLPHDVWQWLNFGVVPKASPPFKIPIPPLTTTSLKPGY
jgi:hypothetical protein